MYERMLAEVENLMDKGGRSPQEMLVNLMEQRKLKQADLLPIFKSRGYVSDVVNAKRAISKAHAKQLADFFNI